MPTASRHTFSAFVTAEAVNSCADINLRTYLLTYLLTYTYMLPFISIYYFHAFYFKRFNSFSLKLLSADGMFIFMSTLVAYNP